MTRFLAVLVIFSFIVCNHLQAHNDGICVLQNDTAIKKSDKDLSPDSISMQKKRKFFLFRLLENALEVDTNYIEQNKYNVTLMSQADWRYKLIWLRGSDDEGNKQSLYFHPHSQVTIGPYASYSLLAFGWTIDIGSKLSTGNSNIH